MREIQASDAKARLPELLDEVEGGETLIVTRRGRAIARIVPEVNRRQEEVDRALASIRTVRARYIAPIFHLAGSAPFHRASDSNNCAQGG